MIIWGGWNHESGYLGDGGRYNPATDTWKPIKPVQSVLVTQIEVRSVIDENDNGEIDIGESEVGGVAVEGIALGGESLGIITTRVGEDTFDGFEELPFGPGTYYDLRVVGAPDLE